MNFEILNKFLFVFILLFIICSCSEEEPIAPTEENLLLNTSFEKNGKFSSDGWFLPEGSDSSTDVPHGGGNYSLMLNANWGNDLYAEIKVPVKTEYSEFKLTFWSKYSVIEGKAILSLVRNGSTIKSLNILVDDIIWQSYSIQDTFSSVAGDSFMVQFTAGFTNLISGKTYFDLCQLQGIK